ncbi:MAG TPA: hypothetical protein P5564_05460 [Paludibacteraceae bacterium]|jgi:hypothetical protein|nr:hypothetical protein [Paludibacteraceae bacterium]HRS68037.1 hypothetical protein [Paludibacteraceae bacterium]
MIKDFTPDQKQKKDKITTPLQPKESTIQTILAFAAAYQVEQLVNGEMLQFIIN